jgi:hypothetical protein
MKGKCVRPEVTSDRNDSDEMVVCAAGQVRLSSRSSEGVSP